MASHLRYTTLITLTSLCMHRSSEALYLFGQNVLSENTDNWRKHRKIMQPAFNTTTYEFVWQETTRIYQDTVQGENWVTKSGDTISIKSINNLTHKIGLYVITACGFGLTFPWTAPPKTDNESSIQSSIQSVERSYLALAYAPKWIWKLPIASLQQIRGEYHSFLRFLHQEVVQRKATIEEALKNGDAGNDYVQQDVFSRLVLANLTDGKNKLSDSELVGELYAAHFSTY